MIGVSMSMRTRLIVAFVLLSVLPLSAVTFYSYSTSVRAFEDAVAREEAQTASDIGRRMTLVTNDVGNRLDRYFSAQTPEALKSAGKEAVQAGLAPMLGAAAAFLDRLEFRPMATSGTAPVPRAADAPPAPGVPPVPPSRPAAGTPPKPPAPPTPIVIDMPAIARMVREATQSKAGDEKLDPSLEAAIEQTVQQGLALGLSGAQAGVRAAAEAIGRLHPPEPPSSHTMHMEGRQLEVPVMRHGRMVGRASAEINLDRAVGAVLALARTDQGEIPFAIDTGGRLYTPDATERPRLDSLGVQRIAADGGPPQREGDWLIVTQKDTSGLVFGVARPLGASLREIRSASVQNLLLGLALIGLALVGIVPISHHMTDRLRALTHGVRQLAAGDFRAHVNVTSNDEVGELARAFNQMAHDLERHQAAAVAQERLHRELELSRLIQNEMLPRTSLRAGAAEVKGTSVPAREVGGDFFNYFELPGEQLAVLVGDVSGKGVSAALLMANVQATLRARLPLQVDLAALADALDRDLDHSTPASVFVTLFVGVLDRRSGTLRYVNAGHHPPYVVRASGRIDSLPGTGLPIALFGGHGYTESRIGLAPGDLVFFYTDGLVETMNDAGDMFGADRVQRLLVGGHADVLDVVLERVEQEIHQFRGAADPMDDVTMMVLRV